MEVTRSVDSNSTNIYPLCYKIKEMCLPNDRQESEDTLNSEPTCLKNLPRYLQEQQNVNRKIVDKSSKDMVQCLTQYGDIYKKLGIELYVNPNTKQILFPDNLRIQANFHKYLRDVNIDSQEAETTKIHVENVMLYKILLDDILKQIYDQYYGSTGVADKDSLQPKKYGIDKLMESNKSSGGKQMRKTKRKKTKRKKTMRKKTRRKKTRRR
jgi:hypothetical protein